MQGLLCHQSGLLQHRTQTSKTVHLNIYQAIMEGPRHFHNSIKITYIRAFSIILVS